MDSEPVAERTQSRIAQRLSSLSPEKIKLLAIAMKSESRNFAARRLNKIGEPGRLVTIRAAGTKRPLFLMHAIGGGVQPFYLLAEYLETGQPVYAIQNHDFGSCQEHQYASIEEMATQYIGLIRAVQPEGPYLLGGWSMGGILAFEMALQLTAQNQKSALVVMFDTPASFDATASNQEPAASLAHDLILMGKLMAHYEKKQLQLSPHDLESLDADGQMKRFFQIIKVQAIVPANVDDTALRAAAKSFVNNAKACRSYVPRTYSGRVIMLRAAEAREEAKETSHSVFDDPAYGWQSFCSQPVTIHSVPGDHIQMMAEPHVQILGATLQRCIDDVGKD